MNELEIRNENMMTEKEKNKFCSLKPTNIEEGKKLYNALEECDFLLSDCINKEISIKDVYIERYEKVDDEGEVKTKYRTIILDIDGKSYATGSYGVYNSIVKLCEIFGLPTWNEGLKVKVSQRKLKDGKQSLTLILQ